MHSHKNEVHLIDKLDRDPRYDDTHFHGGITAELFPGVSEFLTCLWSEGLQNRSVTAQSLLLLSAVVNRRS